MFCILHFTFSVEQICVSSSSFSFSEVAMWAYLTWTTCFRWAVRNVNGSQSTQGFPAVGHYNSENVASG